MKCFVLLLGAVLLAGCANDPCEPGQPYADSHATAPLKIPAGMATPGQDPSMQIPPAKGPVTPFLAKHAHDGRRCLAEPPPLPPERSDTATALHE